ncbi:MAG: exodeoxyribonuclease VII large subunit, partial [Actinomycetota bacterium]|nr:exodeoxyribonuclease VII large subunit [Actinomycetota bacterium]
MTQQSFQFDDAATAGDVDDATVIGALPGPNGSESTGTELTGAEVTGAEVTADEVAAASAPETLSIGEAIRAVNEAISIGVGGLVWVRGELHNTKIAKGHRYFDLVDDAAGNADVRQRPKVSA